MTEETDTEDKTDSHRRHRDETATTKHEIQITSET